MGGESSGGGWSGGELIPGENQRGADVREMEAGKSIGQVHY